MIEVNCLSGNCGRLLEFRNIMTLRAVSRVVTIEVDPIKARAACDSLLLRFKGCAGDLCYVMTQVPQIATECI